MASVYLEDLQRAIVELVHEAGGIGNLVTPRGYRHLGLIIVDSVFSLGARYDSVVVPLLERYSREVSAEFWSRKDDPETGEHTAQDLLVTIERIGDRKYEIFNHQKIRRRTKNHLEKVVVVQLLARQLVQLGASSCNSFRSLATNDNGFESEVRSVPGVGIACYRYLCNLAGIQSVKPDTHVVSWVNGALRENLPPEVVASELESAVRSLRTQFSIDIRQIDHLIWRKQSSRKLGKS